MQISATTELLPHQQAAVDKLLPARVGALFMEMGTGKSRTVIELARHRQARISKVAWFTLVSLKETVRYEICKHTSASAADVYLFDQKTTDDTLPCASWYVIGLESLGGSDRVVLAANRLITDDTMVIVDESSYIKGHRAKRTLRVTAIAQRARYRVILTGTPISQGVQDLFSQMYFLSPKILGYQSWYSFARNHLEYSDRYKGLIVSTHNEEWLAAKIAPYTYQVTKGECLSLPDKIYDSFYCTLTEEQIEYYEFAKEEFFEDVMKYDTGSKLQCSIPIFRLFSRLQSICCGFWRDGRGEVVQLPNKRFPLLLDIIDQVDTSEKLIIWGKYRPAVDDIVASLVGRYGSDAVCQYHGGLDEHQRHIEVERWRGEKGRFLVATQDAGGHGLDLTAASNVIFYGNGFKYSARIQAEDRCHRIGQTRTVTYIDIWADCGIEGRIRSALISKGDTVSSFRDEVNAIREHGNGKGLKKLLDTL